VSAKRTLRPGHLALAVLLLTAAGPAVAAAQGRPVWRDSVTVVPGPQFSTTSWIRWLGTALFGARYRELWRTAISLPLLDIQATAGGLRLAGVESGLNAGRYRLIGGDGSHWTFSPLDRRDPRTYSVGVLPKDVNSGVVADLASGRNPAGPLVAAALARAAGVPNQPAWLVAVAAGSGLLPAPAGDSLQAGYLLRDDPVASPDSTGPVAPGAVLTSLAVLHRTLQDPNERVDARAVLQVLLFNVYLNSLAPDLLDWRWEAVAGDSGMVWRPLGLFRETALARYDGIAAYLARPLQPDLTTFGPTYPHNLTGMPDQTSAFRYMVGALGRPVWDSMAAELQTRMTAPAIDAAVRALPAAYQAQWGPPLAARLRERRDRLPQAVEYMYRAIRKHAEVHATNTSDDIAIAWPVPDSLVLSLPGATQRFAAAETDWVTLFLGEGPDTLRFHGERGRAPALRLVAPTEGTVVVDGSPGRSPVALYGTGVEVRAAEAATISRAAKAIPSALANIDTTGAERTEGRRNLHPTTWLEVTSGVGMLIGGGVVRTDWSGDARPYRSRVTLRAAYGTDANSGVVQLLGDFRWAGSPLQLNLDLAASGVGAVYFYGFGNDTPGDSTSSYYRAGRDLYGGAASLLIPLSNAVTVGGGIEVKAVHTPLDSNLYIGLSQPYGSPEFGEAGLTATATYDTRDVLGAPRRGVYATLNGAWYPIVEEGGSPFGTLTASVAGYHTPGWWRAMTVAARLSGTATFGDTPYFEAAFVGGGRTVRGLPQGRYEGNQAVYANLDLRLRVSRIQFVLPWDFGVLGLADVGRVFVAGEASGLWHPSFGGGLWVALLDRSLAASLNVATGAGQGTFINAAGGFTF